jgi:hypothetical protein
MTMHPVHGAADDGEQLRKMLFCCLRRMACAFNGFMVEADIKSERSPTRILQEIDIRHCSCRCRFLIPSFQ